MDGMTENVRYPEHMVFGLDIGTRSLVGSVGYMDHGKFNVVAHCVKEHETRAMMDGQIHDISKVGESISIVKHELEQQLDRKLKDVCIAAAGRVLKTVTVHVENDREDDIPVDDEEIYSMELMGIEKAYEIMKSDFPDDDFYCVGYTAVRYFMNDYVINNLEGHKAKKIGADILATFLPYEVVEGLYSAVEQGGLQVASLTLEPIAAINVAIPEQYRLLNIALVDVGAGTSDICITKDGSIIAYGMIPHAGDEITEQIVHKCLVDFQTAEKIKRASLQQKQISYKDIMGLTYKITADEVRKMYKDTVDSMTKEIAGKIKELNGGKSVSAVFVVGGGGKAFGFTSSLADALKIQKERVALRGEEVLGDVNFLMEGVKKDPLLVTPIGICINYYNQKNNFIVISVNDRRIKLYNNDKLTVVDGLLQAGVSNVDLFPKRGRELTFYYNGNKKIIRGQLGDGAIIKVNEKEANINTRIDKNDKITITPSVEGAAASYRVEQLPEYHNRLRFMVDERTVECPRMALANGELVTGSYDIKEGDNINIPDYYTVSQLMQFIDLNTENKEVYVNGHLSVEDEPVYSEFKITLKEKEIRYDDLEYDETYVTKAERDAIAAKEALEEEMKKREMAEKGEISDIVKITVTVNGTAVTMNKKSGYMFADVFESYPFDTREIKGTDLVAKRNGVRCEFVSEIFDGDVLELYWV